MNWTEQQKKWFCKNDRVKLCIKTGKPVMPPSVSGLLEKPYFVKSNFILCASDSQASVFIRLRLTKGLDCSLNFLWRNLVDHIHFSLIFLVHVPKRFLAHFFSTGIQISLKFLPLVEDTVGGCKKQRWKSRGHLNNFSIGEQPWPACPHTGSAALQILWWVCRNVIFPEQNLLGL